MADDNKTDDELDWDSELSENEDDLLSDFNDILDDDDSGSDNEQANDNSESKDDDNVDELEAFLDEFEFGGSDGEEGDKAADDSPVEENAQQGEEEEPELGPMDFGDELPEPDEPESATDTDSAQDDGLELAADELDLSDGSTDSEEGGEDASADEEEFQELDLDDFGPDDDSASEPSEPSGEAGADDAPPDDFEPMGELDDAVAPAAAMSEQSAAEPKSETPPAAAQPAVAEGGGRKAGIALALGVIGMLVGAGAVAFAWVLNGEVVDMSRQVETLESRLATAGSSQSSTPSASNETDKLQREVEKLSARLSELAIIVEGPVSHLRETNERELAVVSSKMDALEQAIGGVVNDLEALEKRVTKVATAPTPAPAQAAPAKVRSTSPTPAPRSSGWVVNLLSLSSRADAESERNRLRRLGINAQLETAEVNGRTWYRLRVGGFGSKNEAEAYSRRVSARANLSGAWVTQD